jgi:hypothetical protein
MNRDIHANPSFTPASDDARCRIVCTIKCCILSKPVIRIVVLINICFFLLNFSWSTNFLLQYENPTEVSIDHAYGAAPIFQA